MTVTVNFKGPIFDGSAQWILTQGIEEARRALADEALDAVRVETGVFKNPTGRFKSLLNIENAGFASRVVPGFLPYVRWLEGTSRRNQTTRFKGYHLFRNARMRIEARALPLFEERLRPAIARLNR